MADKRIQHTERMVGAGHPTFQDTLNRLTLVEHGNDGSHRESVNAVNYATLSAALTAIGATERVLVVSGALTASTTQAVPSNVTLRIVKGGSIAVSGGVTVTINGTLEAGPYQIFSGTGTVAFGNLIRQVHPEWWGADPSGTNDSTSAVQKAVRTEKPVQFGAGTYKFDNATVYLDSSSQYVTYILSGIGKATILKPVNFTSGYLFKLNEDSGGSKVYAYPPHPRLLVEDLQVDGSGSTSVSFLWYNEASFKFKNLLLNSLLYGAYGTGYTDQVTLDFIVWTNPKTNGWIYRQGSNGDSFYARQIFTTGPNAIWLYKCAGGVIESCNGGSYKFQLSHGIVVQGCHIETTASASPFIIEGTDIAIKKNYLWNNAANAIVYINDDNATNYRQKSKVVLDNNAFIFYSTTSTNTRGNDIYINTFDSYSRLILRDNSGYVYSTNRWIFEPVGIKAGSAYAGVNTLLSNNPGLLQGNVELKYINGAWDLLGPEPNHGIKGSKYINDTTISAIATSTNFAGDLVNGTTYYYKVAVYDVAFGNTVASAESSRTITATGQSVQLNIDTKAYPGVLRLWRGTSAGVYTHWVDIPFMTVNLELYDQGTTIAGYAWSNVGVPAVPTANTTKNGWMAGLYKTFYDSAAPAAGTWARGDRVINHLPAVGQPKSWVCTVAGTPGTWMAEGNL